VSVSFQPYTHAHHSHRCIAAARNGVVLRHKLVQVRRGPVVCCAQIVEALSIPGAGDCWKVNALFPWNGLITVPVRNVRECSSIDGLCSCQAEALESHQ
jgi:hypothetical protein